MTALLEDVNRLNDDGTWMELLNFPSRYLRVPVRGGKRWKLARLLNDQLTLSEDDPIPSPANSFTKKSQAHPILSLAARVSAKLEEGDFRGAIRLASTEDTIAEDNDTTIAALRSKHPAAHPDSDLKMQALPASVDTLSVTEDAVMRAIHSFPKGSSGGRDGLLPQHLKDMTSKSAGTEGTALMEALTSFTNLVLAGNTPPQIGPIFFGASLTALNKKGGGIRPIAVGSTLRRLVAKTASMAVMEEMGNLLAPLQLGYGTPLGGEAAAHASRKYLHNLPSDHVLLKLDFKNAFNSIRRDKMLEAVMAHVPQIYPFVFSCYSSPSTLFLRESTIQSAEGVQQGDPLGPLLFCLTIHPLITPLISELRIFYLDDGTLGGPEEDVLQDLEYVEREAATLGLQLNHAKTELICEEPAGTVLLHSYPDLCKVPPDETVLLGSPIGQLSSIDAVISSKVSALRTMSSRLQYLQKQDALLLLRQSFAIPKIMYCLRTAPCFLSPTIRAFDQELRSALSCILNANLDAHSTWTQATLPVASGGLGIRSATHLAPSAFLASAAGCTDLLTRILPDRLKDIPYPFVEAAEQEWRKGHSEQLPSGLPRTQQKAWDAPRVQGTYHDLLSGATSHKERARLLASATRESGAWLNALPVAALGLRLDDEVVRIATGLRLGVPLCEPHLCHHCGTQVDELATHGLSCVKSQGRYPRHTTINTIVKASLARAQIPSTLEPVGLCRLDGKRPDGVTITPWESGKSLIWDVTCPDTFAASHEAAATRVAGAVAEEAEERKKQKYNELTRTHHVIPLAIETAGVFGPDALNFFHALGRRIIATTNDPHARSHMIQQISVALQRGNAASVLGTFPVT